MKKKKWKNKDGETRYTYKLEKGDKVVSRFDEPKKSEPRGIVVNGKAKVITDYYLGVIHEGNEITLNLTEGQYKALKNAGNINSKEIEAIEYEKEFEENGKKVVRKLVGVKVL